MKNSWAEIKEEEEEEEGRVRKLFGEEREAF